MIFNAVDILEDFEADGNCKMLQEDITDVIHGVRRRY
jgi:hypothetical protein